MTEDQPSQPSRLDRIEATLESQLQLNAAIRADLLIQSQQIERHGEQIQRNAELIERNALAIEQLREQTQADMQAVRENLLIQSDNIVQLSQVINQQITPAIVRLAETVTTLAEEFRQHRSDGHGA